LNLERGAVDDHSGFDHRVDLLDVVDVLGGIGVEEDRTT
jgi:hypothetical protein